MNILTLPANVFINDLRKISSNKKLKERYLEELKVIAAQNEINIDNFELNINKLVFMQLRGVKIREIDFVKALSHQNFNVKEAGMIGLLGIEMPESGILLINTISKDLSEKKHVNSYLNFIGNFRQGNCGLSDVLSKLEPTEMDESYKKYLVCKAKHLSETQAVISNNPSNLLVLLQLKLKYNKRLSENEIMFIITQLYKNRCPFTTCKILRSLRNFDASIVDKKLLEFLKKKIVPSNVKARKQVEIAVSLEVCSFLISIDEFDHDCEAFIIRLLNSKNFNSRFVGLKFVVENRIPLKRSGNSRIIRVALEKCIESVQRGTFFSNSLHDLIDEKNCLDVYLLLDKKAYHPKILQKIYSSTNDPLFRSKMLFETPSIYSIVKTKGHKIDISDFLISKNISHFRIVYDNFDSKKTKTVTDLIANHLKTLTMGHLNILKIEILNELFGFALSYGDAYANREVLLRFRHIKQVVPGILMFNMILPDKIAIINNEFVQYTMAGDKITGEEIKIFDGEIEIRRENERFDISKRNDAIYLEYEGCRKLIVAQKRN